MRTFPVTEAANLVAHARADAGLTQAALAKRAGVSQPNLAAMESGTRTPSPAMLSRVLRAADYRPSVAVTIHANAMREAAE